MDKMMKVAFDEALKGIKKNDGGPFGAVVVKNGKIISSAHNKVLKTKDPTAHAEIRAIRKASKKLKNFDLSDCVLYTTSKPCPMCLGAIYWARIKRVYYGTTEKEVADIGFDDKKFYDLIKAKKDSNLLHQIDHKENLKLLKIWKNKKDKIIY